MGCSLISLPEEVIQKIVLFATFATSSGPPQELYTCLLTCRQFSDFLSPRCAGELYSRIFAHKFDALVPAYRLSPAVVRNYAALELRRRFSALKIFKNKEFYHSSLKEALWIAYLMLEEADLSQKNNVNQLLQAKLPSFLDLYLRSRLYNGAESNNGWPLLSEQNSLAIALSWALTSQSSINSEKRCTSDQMRKLLKPIVFASYRYSIFSSCEDLFSFSGNLESSDLRTKSSSPSAPRAVLPPCEITYFGEVKRQAHPPSAALFSALLYFVRTESVTPYRVPSHVLCSPREEAAVNGSDGLCLEDYEHFYRHCRTKFVDFLMLDKGIQLSSLSLLPDAVLCQTPRYKLGTLSGPWQGSQMIPFMDQYEKWTSSVTMVEGLDYECRTPVYFSLEEHYCCDSRQVVPIDDKKNGMKNAWLPAGLQASAAIGSMMFSDLDGTFKTVYHTYHHGQSLQADIVDVIITGKTDQRYILWGGGTVILGRVRIQDGLVVLVKYLPDNIDDGGVRQLFRGYVTLSQNLVGKVKGAWPSSDSYYEGIFSLNKNNDTRYI